MHLLQDVLPMDAPLHAFTIRQHVYKVGERLEQALGEEQRNSGRLSRAVPQNGAAYLPPMVP